MMTTPVHKPPLNEVQLMLLQLFSRPMDADDLAAIRTMLLNYYDTLLQKELDNVIAEKHIQRADFDNLLQQSRRTK
jgi:hypothetical protein